MRRDVEAVAALVAEVAREVEFPPTPELAQGVRRRIEAGPVPVGTIHLPPTRPPLWRPLGVAASVLALVLALTLTLSATARRAVADLLGIVGIHITFDEEAIPTEGTPRLQLGERVDLRSARERAGFHVAVPERSVVKGLDRAVYYEPGVGSTGMVSLVYPARADRLGELDLLVTQFAAAVDEAYLKKLAGSEGGVTFTEVRGAGAYWVGHRHLMYYVRGTAEAVEEPARLAGKVLLWEEGGITYRVEGAPSLAEALRVAVSLR